MHRQPPLQLRPGSWLRLGQPDWSTENEQQAEVAGGAGGGGDEEELVFGPAQWLTVWVSEGGSGRASSI